ncbi:Oidioi.mRNA.OKI2018_I69.chr1.g1140.t1.cds [Oikopleura dioica]|uniref:Oidioi.mRNA.OKI2018_I69.chr1.g1140.t1.cds n=1 Tax=Oikopleura dioica TaxID=34765 RepID=A0ABN7SLZ6_OIKDI|nr:Oidioi.mRNA.OKI2018_I69.chr1.g1140.t1.cds [Oikopleura dioica]
MDFDFSIKNEIDTFTSLFFSKSSKKHICEGNIIELSCYAGKLNFHFHHFLSSNEGARARVDAFSRDTPLHISVRQNSPEVVSFLLAAGAKVDAINGQGQTALHLAAFYGRKEIAEILLKDGAPIEIVDLRKMSPLAVAVQKDHLHIVRLLKRFGANFQREKESSLLVAVRLHRSNIINYILQQDDFDLSKETEGWKLAISKPQIATQILQFYVPSVAGLEDRERRFWRSSSDLGSSEERSMKVSS